jgi:hypothetical protein
MVVVALVSMLGMSALVMDIGYAYVVKRRAQSTADAATMAAVQNLPDTSAASTTAASYATKNSCTGCVTTAFGQTYSSNDTVTGTATITAPSFFGKVLGFNSYTARASATAWVGSYTSYGLNVAPWTLDRPHAHQDFGNIVTFKVASGKETYSPGNFGAVDLPLKESSCGLSGGTSDYRDLISGAKHSCGVKVGDVLQSEPGDMGSNTRNALQDRGAVTGYNPYSALQLKSDGTYEIKDYKNPNVIVIPIVTNFENGAKTFTVTTFAWFVITDYGQKDVTGMFVRSAAQPGAICPTATNPNAPCTIGARDEDGMSVMQMSG